MSVALTQKERDALDALKASGGVRFEVPKAVQAAHAQQRGTVAASEPPKPYSIALAKRRAAEGRPADPAAARKGEVPQPYSLALKRRKAAEAR